MEYFFQILAFNVLNQIIVLRAVISSELKLIIKNQNTG